MASRSQKSSRSTSGSKADDDSSSNTDNNNLTALERIEKKIDNLVLAVEGIRADNVKLNKEVDDLKRDNRALFERVEELEAQSRLDSLIIYGLPPANYADAAGTVSLDPSKSTTISTGSQNNEAEQAVIQFC